MTRTTQQIKDWKTIDKEDLKKRWFSEEELIGILSQPDIKEVITNRFYLLNALEIDYRKLLSKARCKYCDALTFCKTIYDNGEEKKICENCYKDNIGLLQ